MEAQSSKPQIHQRQGAFQEALSWVQHGMALVKKHPHSSMMASHNLAHMKRTLLTKLGRGNEALEAAWAEYRADPNKYSYAELMKYVPTSQRVTWHTSELTGLPSSSMHGDWPGATRLHTLR